MGHKVNPKGFRIGRIYPWNSLWFVGRKEFGNVLRNDVLMRKFIMNELKEAGIEKVQVERLSGEVVVNITAARPGVVIGRAGSGVEELKKKLLKNFVENKIKLTINIKEVERPSLSSPLVLQAIIQDLEKRIPFRRAMKQAIAKVQRAGGQGVKVVVSGRLNGAEIARTETLSVGKVPLHTIRADVDYSRGAAHTLYGAIGVKVWIYRGEIFKKEN
jgi:small subunit ribosomal protein S3